MVAMLLCATNRFESTLAEDENTNVLSSEMITISSPSSSAS